MRQDRDVSSMSDEGVFVIQRFYRPYIVRVSPAIYLPYPMAISTTIMVYYYTTFFLLKCKTSNSILFLPVPMAISTTIMVYYYNTFFLLLSKNAQLHLTNEELHLIERRTASDKHRLAKTMLLYDTGGVGYDKSLFPDKYLTNIRKLDYPFRKKFG